MSGECDKCGEHATECDCIRIAIFPPAGKTFKECDKCKNPFIYDGTVEICLWCLINKENQGIIPVITQDEHVRKLIGEKHVSQNDSHPDRSI